MTKTTKLITIALATFLGSGLAMAQKANVKGAEKIADKKGDFNEARALIGAALENEETKNEAKTHYIAGYVEEKAFVSENMKSVEGGEPNSKEMNKALLTMFDFYMGTIKLEQANSKNKYSKKIKESFTNNYLYFINAGAYYMQNQNYKEALRAFEDFQQIKKLPLMAETPVATTDSNSMMVDFFAVVVAYQANEKQKAIELAEKIKTVEYRRNDLIQILTQTYLETGDTVKYIATMEEGMNLYPDEPYYSVNLINTLIQMNRTDEAITRLGKAIEQSPKNAQLYDVMGKLYEQKNDEKSSLQWYEKALALDPNFTESNFNMGRVYFNQAVTIKNSDKFDKTTEAQANELFKKALPYLEKAYSQKPEQSAYILSQVYYNLKMNDKYEEINKKNEEGNY